MFKYEVKPDEVWGTDHDWVIMRYAEILMKANVISALAHRHWHVRLLNRRTRAGIETPQQSISVLDEELKHEFVFEGHRRTDNIRMGDFFEAWWISKLSIQSDIPDSAKRLDKTITLLRIRDIKQG